MPNPSELERERQEQEYNSETVFKEGDRVVCMRSASTLREGEEFIVTEYYQGLVSDMIVDLIDMQGRRVTYAHASRFKLKQGGDNGRRTN